MSTILKDAEEHISRLLAARLPAGTTYHSIDHARETVEAAREIGDASGIVGADLESVLLAAWFHDAGYIEGAEGHEERSAEAAEAFLRGHGYPDERVRIVRGCILATRVPQRPTTPLERILADADMIHLGKKRFFERAELMRRETEMRSGESFEEAEWLRRNIAFVESHEYHTSYARKEFDGRRGKNLKKLRARLAALESAAQAAEPRTRNAKGTQEPSREKERLPERGIETMFRTVPRNHLDLSAMADSKANILLSTCMIIVSVTIGLIGSKVDTHAYLLAPAVILMAVCLSTMVLAILSTRPNVAEGKFTREDIRRKKVNLLFFGNFHGTELEDFEWGIKEMMRDRDYLYGSMIRDLYYLGKVLGQKYRYLRLAYTVFMWGMIVSVLAFVFVLATAPQPLPPVS